MPRHQDDRWTARDWTKRIADADKSRSERARALIKSASQAKIADQPLERLGVTSPTSTRYASTANSDSWAPLAAGDMAVQAALNSITDGRDRLLFGWPERPGNGFTLAALTAREARATGRLASGTLGVWPWRSGLMRAARSVLVHPQDIAKGARVAVNDLESGHAWPKDGLAHRDLDMLELRLNDLVATNAPRRIARGRKRLEILVRSPTLVETTAIFEPQGGTFKADPDQVLRRVRNYTLLRDSGAAMPVARAAIGNPLVTPFAILGLPPEKAPKKLSRYMQHKRIEQRGLDAVIVDLTRQSRAELGDWERSLSALLEALDSVPGRRPPIVAVCEDPFALKGALRTLRTHAARLKPRRQWPIEVGIYLAEPGLLGRASALPEELGLVLFTADIKDASLVGLREKLVTLGRRLREGGDTLGARAVGKALSFLRRVASLPLGLDEARETIDVLFDAEDDVDAEIRALFRPRMALAPLALVAETSPDGTLAREAVELIEAHAAAWSTETPVSAKLAGLLVQKDWNSPQTLIAVSERRIAEALMSSDRAVAWRCGIVDHSDLAAAFERGGLQRVIVTGVTSVAIRTLLTNKATPPEVIMLGDASGSALLAGELGPLVKLPGFAPVAARAASMEAALKRGGLNERLDAGESEFRIFPVSSAKDIDLTREGDTYVGEKFILTTSAHRIAYRPSSDVLVFTSGEARPFERVAARDVERGDEVLVLDEQTRDRMRDALATSRTSLTQLAAYHAHVSRIRETLPGTGITRARAALMRMRAIDPSLPDSEVHNVQRWLTADLGAPTDDGARQPRAARDWPRFRLFMKANDVDEALADAYWRFAIVPTRSYRVQEGFQFNQRVVQFVLDPESFAGRTHEDVRLRRLWLSLLDAVDSVEKVETVSGGKSRE